MTTPTKQHGSDANRQTSERERLAEYCELEAYAFGEMAYAGLAAQLRADEAEIAQLRTDMQQLRVDLARERLTHTETAANLAAADEQVRVSDEIIAALRAENGRLKRERASEDVRLADVIAERDRLRAENEALRTVKERWDFLWEKRIVMRFTSGEILSFNFHPYIFNSVRGVDFRENHLNAFDAIRSKESSRASNI